MLIVLYEQCRRTIVEDGVLTDHWMLILLLRGPIVETVEAEEAIDLKIDGSGLTTGSLLFLRLNSSTVLDTNR